MNWDIEFSQEAANYALDSYPYNESILEAIEMLTLTADGLPTSGTVQRLEDWCIWEFADHTIVYEITPLLFHIYIWLIKPTE